jgi:hypothetical protein
MLQAHCDQTASRLAVCHGSSASHVWLRNGLRIGLDSVSKVLDDGQKKVKALRVAVLGSDD